jgi:hypothetical protein
MPVIDSGGWDPGVIGTGQVWYYAFDWQTVSFRRAALRLSAFPGGEVIGYVDWQRDYEPRRHLTWHRPCWRMDRGRVGRAGGALRSACAGLATPFSPPASAAWGNPRTS